MKLKNLIINGDFDSMPFAWKGTDLEILAEKSYHKGASKQRVGELDAHKYQTTVMEQKVSIEEPLKTKLTFDTSLRDEVKLDAGEGFRVEILDANGGSVASLEVYPTSHGWSQIELPVEFTKAGTYTVRFTELGKDDSYGAIIDNIEMMICFTSATHIRTPDGTTQARDIKIGDLISTERGPKPVRWVGLRKLSAAELAAEEKLRPVRISAGALGDGLPQADLSVSRQHRIMIRSTVCERMFSTPDALIAAIHLCTLQGVQIDDAAEEVEYVHILFDEHEIVYAENTPVESLLLGEQAKKVLPKEALEEIRLIFPGMENGSSSMTTAKLIPPGSRQKGLVSRLAKNDKQAITAALC